ncbi:MAG TPA: TadE family protein [Ornithinimicrobium sp.]|uniref:TadE/TadG family type IV pilus assembly protein n=1 Tax=Ornithinimicrobium sp. TaxID=1977084 RepID=UPI002B495923|nr:TadE family protein [Ornithinimicrobium sp.]HKJ11233.1 TadE family protein [Ornithinimicrobium sp.]
MSPPQGGKDSGAAVAEFALVAALVTLLFSAVLQLGYALHVHNTATAHVIEGARVGARAGNSTDQGAARAEALLVTSLSGRYADSVSARRTTVGGVDVVEVEADLPVPLVGPLGPGESMTVTGQAFAEDQ